MPTYVYETIPESHVAPERFEIRQAMSEPPLERHPETLVPIRRVISGGMGMVGLGGISGSSMPEAGPGCGPGACGCGRFPA